MFRRISVVLGAKLRLQSAGIIWALNVGVLCVESIKRPLLAHDQLIDSLTGGQ